MLENILSRGYYDRRVLNEINKNYFKIIQNLSIKKSFYKNTRKMTICFKFNNGHYEDIVSMEVENNFVYNSTCNCGNGYRYRPCIHMMASYKYIDENPDILINDYYEDKFNRLIDEFKEEKDLTNKDIINLEVLIEYEVNYNDNIVWNINLKIGTTKLYSIKQKIRSFLSAYNENKKFLLGKDFEFNPRKQKFREEDQLIIDFFNNKYNNNYYINQEQLLQISKADMNEFLALLKNKPFSIKDELYTCNIDHIEEGIDLNFNIKEDGNFAKLKLNVENLKLLTNSGEYVFTHNSCFHVPLKERKILKNFLSITEGKELNIKKEDISTFNSIILPKIKKIANNIEVDSTLKEKINIVKPKIRIYFDYNKNKLIANLKFKYNDNEISYFENNDFITRDPEIEKDGINYLENCEFIFDNKKKNYYIDDIEKIGTYLENEISSIPDNFEFMISESLKKINISKTPSIKADISLGKDEWLKYDFNIAGIEKIDFDEIMDSIHSRKKYVKLKSGSIINLSNAEDFEELDSLLDNLDIDYKKLENMNFKIPKYKALYMQKRMEKENYINTNTDSSFNKFLKDFSKFKNSKINFIDKYDLMLRPYQETGVNFLTALSKCGFGGILADEMGLGKTFQAITYIKHKLYEDNKLKFLIVSPTALLYNWQNEFKTFSPNIRVKIMNLLPIERKKELNNISDINVIITSYGLIRQDIEEYMNITFDTIIIDEAQNIKNINAGTTKALKLLNSTTKFALTGTPIENSLLELFSIFDFLMPGYFSTINKFNNKYQKPILKEQSIEALNELNEQVKPFILRRRKKDVLKDLPDKMERNILIDLNDNQKKIYLSFLEMAKKEINQGDFNKNQIKILSILTRLRQICISPSLFMDSYNGDSSKIDAVINTINEAISGGHKILLFSQFTSALQLLIPKLNSENISYYYIDGQTKSKERMRLVDSFNIDSTSLFLISLKAGGVGLNLTSADVVIHLDFWWNPAVENQATDRAHRIGQKNIVEVIKIVCQGTIEERVLELQKKKKKLADGILEQEDRDKAIISKLTEEDIKKLLEI